MLGMILMLILAVLGVYLLGDALRRKMLCTRFVEATVVQQAMQEKLDGKGRQRTVKFPVYQFTLDGETHLIKDYDAGRRSPTLGERVPLYCSPKKPETLWYVSGRLWSDALWGAISLAGAVVVALLYW